MDNYLKGMVEEIPEKREKRYYLTEVEKETLVATSWNLCITESELRRRIYAIFHLMEAPAYELDFECILNILLHGEGKEKPWPDPADIIQMRGKEPGKVCPSCGRQKARSFEDCAKGLCPKWYAIRDPDAAQDCVEHSRMTLTTNSEQKEPKPWTPKQVVDRIKKTGETIIMDKPFTPTRKECKRVELEALICEREGMIAENKQREVLNQSMAYVEDSFLVLAERIRLFAIPCAKESEKNACPGRSAPLCEYTGVCKGDPQRADYCPLMDTPVDPEKEICPHCFMGRVNMDNSKPSALGTLLNQYIGVSLAAETHRRKEDIMERAKENYEQQMKDSDQIFTAISTGYFDDFKQAEQAVAMLYAIDLSFSRAGISHALKRLERFYAERSVNAPTD